MSNRIIANKKGILSFFIKIFEYNSVTTFLDKIESEIIKAFKLVKSKVDE